MGDTAGKEQSIGIKGLYRAYHSWNILDIIELSGSLLTCLKLGCSSPNAIYFEFVDRFNKLYTASAMFVNNVEILEDVAELLFEDWKYVNEIEFRSKFYEFLNVFNRYLIQLKKDGFYNPEILMTQKGEDDVWRESI